MSYADDPESYRKRLEAKLAPTRIRSTLAFAGLYQLTHELLKKSVIDEVKGFYGFLDVNGGVWVPADGETAYRSTVLQRDRNPFTASLLWLLDMAVITTDEMDRLDEIYAHRHDLTHELAKYIVDPDLEPDVELFADALKILKGISRFWVQVEKDIGTFDEINDIEIDEVVPLASRCWTPASRRTQLVSKPEGRRSVRPGSKIVIATATRSQRPGAHA